KEPHDSYASAFQSPAVLTAQNSTELYGTISFNRLNLAIARFEVFKRPCCDGVFEAFLRCRSRGDID
ncbi:hypothetical protein LLE49_16475, partial [Alicyclobacillus tolerans]|uniref:hypothetical protein n=1 Tax=Alicyclobacillus tolerans TaxID=90970 RepID=UPI001F2D5A0F